MLSGVKVRDEATVVSAYAVAVFAGLLPETAVVVVVSNVPMAAPAGICTFMMKLAEPPAGTVKEDIVAVSDEFLICTVQP